MAKISISRLLETAKFLSTKAGQELADFITYVADLSEQVLRTLNNAVTIRDNLDAKIVTVSLKHDAPQVINTGGKYPVWIAPARVISSTYGSGPFVWFVSSSNEVVVKLQFVGAYSTDTVANTSAQNITVTKASAPPASQAIDVTLVIFFG